jgi:hypothetical protein
MENKCTIFSETIYTRVFKGRTWMLHVKEHHRIYDNIRYGHQCCHLESFISWYEPRRKFNKTALIFAKSQWCSVWIKFVSKNNNCDWFRTNDIIICWMSMTRLKYRNRGRNIHFQLSPLLYIYAIMVWANSVDPDQPAYSCCMIRVCTVGF